MEYKIFGNNSNSALQKQQTYHQKHQLQYQDPAAQHVSILKLPHQQNSLFKSQNATHKREQLKSQHQS